MHILIADDDPNLRTGLGVLFGQQGFQCTLAADGEQALNLIRTNAPDICVLDVMMPELDGFELCRTLRQEGFLMPVIFLTARDSEQDQLEGLNLGADDYMAKPFSPAALVARVNAKLRRTHYARDALLQPAQPFTMAGIAINPASLTAHRGELSIQLTKREMTFLCLANLKQGEALSKDHILDHCWGRAYLPSSRVLDQFIATLRRKLEREMQSPRVIHTIHGVGYRYGTPDS